MHSFVLRFKCEDVLWALRPRLAVVRVDVRHHVRDAVFVMADCFRVAVEVVDAVRLPIEVSLVFEGVVTVEGDDDFDAVASRVEHEVIEAIEHFVVPGLGGVAFETGVAVYLGAFLGGRLAWDVLERSCVSWIVERSMTDCYVDKDSPSSQTRSTCMPASFRPVNNVVCWD